MVGLHLEVTLDVVQIPGRRFQLWFTTLIFVMLISAAAALTYSGRLDKRINTVPHDRPSATPTS